MIELFNSEKLTDNFIFTQHSLGTFEKCPLKFKLRYIDGIRWNTSLAADIKNRIETGRDFHILARRYFMGIETGIDNISDKAPELARWMKALQQSFKLLPSLRYLPEYKLRSCNGHLRVEANFDLLIVGDHSVEIWDWKTSMVRSGKKKLELQKLHESLQTLVYLFVLKERLDRVIDGKKEGITISMRYWQPEPAGIVASIDYSGLLHERFRLALDSKITRVMNYDYRQFDKKLYSKHCRYCEFNWICNKENVDYEAVMEEID